MVKKSDSAVSPVIGVMLMIVVTVIIAGVVTSFAGGMASDTNKAPTANIHYVGVMDGVIGGLGEPGLVFENSGGDPIQLDTLTLNLRNTATGEEATISFTDAPSSAYRNISVSGECRLKSDFTYRFKKIGIQQDTLAYAGAPINLRVAPGEMFVIHADRYIESAGTQGSVYYVAERGGSIYSEGTFKVAATTEYSLVEKNTGAVISSGKLVGTIL